METQTIDPRTTPLDIGPDCEAPEDASVCSIWTDYPEAVNVEVAGRVLVEYGPLFKAAPTLYAALRQAVDESGFSISGPTDWRAAEHGEPKWVCNARAALAQARPETTQEANRG